MSKLYENVNDIPKGSIKPLDQSPHIGDEIVRGMWIDSIKFHKEYPLVKPVLGKYDVEKITTVCTIVLVGDGIKDMSKDGIPTNGEVDEHDKPIDIRPLEIGKVGEREQIVVQGHSVCRCEEDYNEEFEKEDAYAMAMNKLAQLKIEILGFAEHEHTNENDLIIEDNTNKVIKEFGTGADPMTDAPVESWGVDGIEVAPDPS